MEIFIYIQQFLLYEENIFIVIVFTSLHFSVKISFGNFFANYYLKKLKISGGNIQWQEK